DHMRAVCTRCGFIHYLNPKVVVGTIPVYGDSILLCRRNIEPRKGHWTLPAGYLENGESITDGAIRETFEETMARVRIVAPYRLFNIVHVNQIYFIFRAELLAKEFGPTSESMDVTLFHEKDIPWESMAFTVIHKTLVHYFEDSKKGEYKFRVGDIDPHPSVRQPNVKF
ncbi:MAG: NUDIX domain-containing protein, partial [Desulfamplus sp.]|nr:NUDIX domain-containing protein [Desulfamplus sp.]